MAATTNGDVTEASASNGANESPYIKELQKNVRNISKKLSSMQKTDTIIAEHPDVSLDELVKQKKINADQKASALKKPQLQSQLAQLEEQIHHYRKFESDNQVLITKQKEELGSKHTEELAKVKEEGRQEAAESGKSQLRNSLLVFSQFLRAAASKRAEEENAESEESKAFEGVLLLVYGGDQSSVDAALKIVEGSDDKAPNIDGASTTVSYAQVKQASIEHSPFQTEEAWVDSVAEAQALTIPAGTDPTLVNAGLTEQQDVLKSGVNEEAVASQALSNETANAAADRWDSNPVSGAGEISTLEESYEVIPRPDEEVDIPAHTAVDEPGAAGLIEPPEPGASASWDDQVPAYAAAPVSKPETDGFQEVAGRSRGGRGRGGLHRGDGEHRGRGRGRGRGGFSGRGRGDGEGRGRGDGEGRGRGDGEGRGRGGRGRGPRGDGPPRP